MNLTAEDVRKFWSRVDRRGQRECWVWHGHYTEKGYGEMRVKGEMHRGRGRLHRAHRISYVLEHGDFFPLPELCVLHRCDNPPCVNPSHLVLGTVHDNVRDRDRKNRTARGSRQGYSELTEAMARDVVAQYRLGLETYRELAQRYPASPRMIREIVCGRSWRQIGGLSPQERKASARESYRRGMLRKHRTATRRGDDG